MELEANRHVSSASTHWTSHFEFTNWVPGVLRVESAGVSFTERGKTGRESLADAELASVSMKKGLISDEVQLLTKDGARWDCQLRGGQKLVDALSARGVAIVPA